MRNNNDVDPLIEAYVRIVLAEDEGGGGGFNVGIDPGTGLAQIGGKSIGSVFADPIKNALKVGAGEVKKNVQRAKTTVKSAATAAFSEDILLGIVKKIKDATKGYWTGFWGSLWLKHDEKIERIHAKYKDAYDAVDKHTAGNADAVFTAFMINPGAVMARVFVPMGADMAFGVANALTDDAAEKLWERFKAENKHRTEFTRQEEKRLRNKWFKQQFQEQGRLFDLVEDATERGKSQTLAENKNVLSQMEQKFKSIREASTIEDVLNIANDKILTQHFKSTKRNGKQMELEDLKNFFYVGALVKIEEEISAMVKYGVPKSQAPVSGYQALYNLILSEKDKK